MGPHAGNRNRPAYSGQPRFRFPKQIIELFAPRPPLPFKPPPRPRRLRPMTGLAGLLHHFEAGAADAVPRSAATAEAKKQEAVLPTKTEPEMDDGAADVRDKEAPPAACEGAENGGAKPPSPTRPQSATFETPARRRRRVRTERSKRVAAIVAERRKHWDPHASGSGDGGGDGKSGDGEDGAAIDLTKTRKEKTGDAYNTVFVGNLPYTLLEARLEDEFERYGPVRKVVMPTDREGFPRGYAFVEFESERDANAAARHAKGMRMEGRRLIVDVERGRTVRSWLPNRLDGPNNSCARPQRRRVSKDRR